MFPRFYACRDHSHRRFEIGCFNNLLDIIQAFNTRTGAMSSIGTHGTSASTSIEHIKGTWSGHARRCMLSKLAFRL